MKHLALFIALVAFSSSAFAEGSYQNEAELRLARAVSVSIGDGVTGGCLSNPNALKVEAELILRRSNIFVSEEPSEDYHLNILVTGWEITVGAGEQGTGECVTMLRASLWRYAKAPEGHWAIIIAYEKSWLQTTNTKASMQERLRTKVSEYASDLANEILKARGN